MKFTKKQIDRYSRQIILKKIGTIGQKKLLKSSVLIVGAGGLGSPIAIYLAALGIGKIGIVDKDNVEISNLSRQIIFETNDVNKNKSSAAISKLRKINPDIQLKSFNKNLTIININQIAKKFDLIVDGSDNFRTRFLINDYCLKNKKIFQSEIVKQIEYTLGQIKNIKLFFISAFNKKDISKILSYLHNYITEFNYVISTSKLNTWLKNITKEIQHPLIENKKINFKYAVQIKEKPVTIQIFCNFSSKLKNNYKSYLINNFNQTFKILNQKTKFIFSSSKNPYV